MSGVSTACGAGMDLLISVAICFIEFCVSLPNDMEGKLGVGSAKRAIMSPTDRQRQSSEIVLVRGKTVRRN